MNKVRIATLDEMDSATPAHALVANVDLVIVRWPDEDEVTGYVLKRASGDVESAIFKNVDEAASVMSLLVDDGLDAAMKKLHTNSN